MNGTEGGMRDGICPKCGGEDVRMQHRGLAQRNYLPAGLWGKAIRLDNYACVACGYVESYVEPGDLSRLVKNWTSVVPRRSVTSA
jgi:hypothetical protein